MGDLQRIFVVSTRADDDRVARLRARLGRAVVVVTAPSAEAKRVVDGLGHAPVPDVLLAPVRHPDVDRGHRLDTLVRSHALADRHRDVVVVADPATVTLLLRALAPGQLPESGPITQVGLPRGPRPLPVGWAVGGGVGLAFVAGVLSDILPWPVLPGLAAAAGAALVFVPRLRHLGQALLLATGVALLATVLAIAGSERFPGNWSG